ncbi:MAG: type II 3-dehydroquinate dehydratase [Acholeplasmataceae bacterium]
MNFYVIHGPNLNLLGKRDSKHYGNFTLEALYQSIVDRFSEHNFTFFQSNHEGEIIDVIQHLIDEPYDGLIVNLGAYTHTSIAIRDALEMLAIPIVDVHLSKIEMREPFRRTNYLAGLVEAHFSGKKEESYFEAINFLIESIV